MLYPIEVNFISPTITLEDGTFKLIGYVQFYRPEDDDDANFVKFNCMSIKIKNNKEPDNTKMSHLRQLNIQTQDHNLFVTKFDKSVTDEEFEAFFRQFS